MNEQQPLVRPPLTVLSSDQIEQTHAYALKILSSVGVRVDSPGARRIFAASDGAILVEEERVLLAPGLVEWAIKSTPPAVDIYDRRGEFVFRLGDDRPRFGIGGTHLYYQDPATDR